MSYDKSKESMLSFILPTIHKEDLEDVCVKLDRNQSQVLRQAITTYVRFIKEQQYIETGVG